MNLQDFEKQRITNMAIDEVYCKCPKCKRIVKPRYQIYFGCPNRSNLYWCPKCLKGEAGMLWIEYGTLQELAFERLEQLSKRKK